MKSGFKMEDCVKWEEQDLCNQAVAFFNEKESRRREEKTESKW